MPGGRASEQHKVAGSAAVRCSQGRGSRSSVFVGVERIRRGGEGEVQWLRLPHRAGLEAPTSAPLPMSTAVLLCLVSDRHAGQWPPDDSYLG